MMLLGIQNIVGRTRRDINRFPPKGKIIFQSIRDSRRVATDSDSKGKIFKRFFSFF